LEIEPMPEPAQIRDLFDRARDLDIDERKLFLDEACPAQAAKYRTAPDSDPPR
jgi:hypothetical protein